MSGGQSAACGVHLPRLAENHAGLIAALHEAAETTDPAPTRFAIDLIRFAGQTGRIAATDGRQLLVQAGFQFPWKGEVLVPRHRVFAAPELLALLKRQEKHRRIVQSTPASLRQLQGIDS